MEALINHNEALLLRQIAAGDIQAYTKVYEVYYSPLVAFAERMVKITQVAEDIVNEIFLNLWQKREQLNAVQSLKAYLFTAARNSSINALKAIARSQSAMSEVQKSFAQKSIDAETQLLNKQYIAFIKKEIANLPPKARQVFTLCRDEGLSYEQVASQLGISRNAVKGHMVASMKKLRRFAEKDLGIPLTLLLLVFVP